MTARHGFDYQPFYCEENVWRWCQHPRVRGEEILVAVIANALGMVRCRQQRASGAQPFVDWDYHVVGFARWAGGWSAWDFDSAFGLPASALEYLSGTFSADDAPELRPTFRVMSGALYVRALKSDRSHMRHRDGRWLQEPPEWAAPDAGSHTLEDLIDMERSDPGEVVDLRRLRERLADPPA
ncbi:MAG: hypothetical protein H0V44_04390 [Planctomycetes bacterium]|nr:hypothetical protein [Planctomycetota bacterium]